MSIIKNRLMDSITLLDTLHCFRQGTGVGAATLEGNLAQKLAGLVHEPLFRVFLYVQKSCDSLVRVRYIEILRGYGLGTNLHRLLQQYCYKQVVVQKAGKLFGRTFGT